MNSGATVVDGARRGVMLVVSSPSGAGKTSLTRRLMETEAGLELSISVTTRAPRSSERNGHDYHFISVGEFERMREAGELLEWAEVFGNFYGTPRAEVMAALEAGRDVLFDIDWQGARQIRDSAPSDLASVFILPPSARELKHRLETRAQDSADVIARRLAGAVEEIVHWNEYDYVIVNDGFDTAFDQLRSILLAERLRTTRRLAMAGDVERLRDDLVDGKGAGA